MRIFMMRLLMMRWLFIRKLAICILFVAFWSTVTLALLPKNDFADSLSYSTRKFQEEPLSRPKFLSSESISSRSKLQIRKSRFFSSTQTKVSVKPDDSSLPNHNNPISRSVQSYNTGTRAVSVASGLVNILSDVSKLIGFSFLVSLLLISWEDLSMTHPMRMKSNMVVRNRSTQQDQHSLMNFGSSTVYGLAFGQRERELLKNDLEPQAVRQIPSYNEVMLKHRRERVPVWKTTTDISSSSLAISKQDVRIGVRTIQQALLFLNECKDLAKDYEWDELTNHIRDPMLNSELEHACIMLQQAKGILSTEARDEIGFIWGSCAWRHCGAIADIQEAIDELDHLIGVLEPYECLFCLDIVERSLRDMLAVTNDYQDKSMVLPPYQPLQRMSSDEDSNTLEEDYLRVLYELRSSD